MVKRISLARRHSARPVTSFMKRLRLGIAGALSATLAASVLVLAVPGTALADCGTDGSGHTDNNSHPWYKKPPGCLDFNLTAATDSTYGYDYYAGFWWNGKTWVEGTRGYVYFKNRSTEGPDVVLLSSVVTGTPMFIVSDFTADNPVQVDY